MKRKTCRKIALAVIALFFMLYAAIILSCIFSCCEDEVVETDAVETVVIEHTHHEEVKEEKLEEEQEINSEELEMLSCLIYREGGGDAVCDECRRRIADVVLNRINSDEFPDTMYEVLTQKRQYGTMHYDGITWPERASKPEEAHAVERAYRTAEDVLSGNHSELYGNGYIWQAEFEQGSSGFWHCGIYFGK